MRNKTLTRKSRIRSKLKKVNNDKPRLSVFRSLNNIYAQLIDDKKGLTIASASSKEKNIEKKKAEDVPPVGAKSHFSDISHWRLPVPQRRVFENA